MGKDFLVLCSKIRDAMLEYARHYSFVDLNIAHLFIIDQENIQDILANYNLVIKVISFSVDLDDLDYG